MTSLRDMNERMSQWQNESSGFNNESEYKPLTGDIVLCNFVSTGSDGDTFILPYKAHIIDAQSTKGKTYTTQRLCVNETYDKQDCKYCQMGLKNIKPRMIMWFWVSNILHAIQPREKNFPAVAFEGRTVFNEEVNGFKSWETSAWSESPWKDIVRLNELYQGLNKFTAQLACTGDGLQRRFKIYPIPNTPGITPELYERAKQECTPCPQMLEKQLLTNVQVVAAPAQPQQQVVNAPTFTPQFTGGFPASPPPFMPASFQPIQPIATPAFQFPTLAQEQGEEAGPDLGPVEDITPPDEDNRRPLGKMF